MVSLSILNPIKEFKTDFIFKQRDQFVVDDIFKRTLGLKEL